MKSLMVQGAKILATGSAIPSSKLSNHQMSKIVETSDEWIFTRTGIKERRLLEGADQSLIDLAVSASKKALNKITMDPSKIDLIILATSSPNDLFGSASKIQCQIGATNAVAFDLTAACSGFVLGLVTASQFLQNNTYSNILVIGADVLSKWVDWSDRSTCILFGDAAGAALLQSCSIVDNSILNFQLNTDGNYAQHLSINYGKERLVHPHLNLYQGSFKYIYMNGKEVYKFAVFQVPLSILKCLHSSNISIEEVDWLLLHQANERILNAIREKLSISSDKIISNLRNYGNTSAASIPLALDETIQEGKILRNDLIVIAGFGAGLTWGTIIIRW
uniref:Beta-ketoacyl-[acyl-carrier-protein] synthase III n=1 Tax=Pleurostichidium falkenbergii TaxID=121064 RepID=A0A4D6UX30_9FLOR|nr:beta-ketoacyl-acyl carrier protein synthase III [Pleurostichidium falkenbergii]QCH39571.1 beta-ketoacyl-acyl carrier protein synthase III [Pleurostichidium falkenbergii]